MSNTPDIRFQNYNQIWESKTLSRVVNFISTGKLDANAAVKNGKYKFFTCSREDYLTDSYEFDGPAVLINGNGDIGLTKVFSGKFNAYQRTYVLMGFNEDFNFVGIAIPNYLPEKIRKEAIGGAMPYIKLETLEELVIKVPTNDEQKQIAEFLFEIDFLINQKQNELDKSVKYKQTMLYKMFPKKGSNIPEIRFTDYSESWVETTLENNCKFYKGKGYSKKDITKTGTQLFLYGRIYTNYSNEVYEIDTYTNLIDPGAYISTGNEVVIPSSGETAEDISRATAILSEGIILGGDLNILVPDDKFYTPFISLLITYSNFHLDLSKKAQGKTVVHVHNDDIKDINFLYPKIDEQKKIVEFFRTLDNLILNQEKEIITLERLKDTLLKKMFA
jgi:type I restriction enzyme S subunit